MMSSPGAKRSTQRPKLVPRTPRVTGWSWALVAPTVMTWRGEGVDGREGSQGEDVGRLRPCQLGWPTPVYLFGPFKYPLLREI